jgi:hypothetical protein
MSEQLSPVVVKGYSKEERTMRNLALISLSALILGFMAGGPPASAQTQAAPSETTVQKPDGSVQTNDRSHEGTVTIDREWKAQAGKNEPAGSVKTDEGHETIGRDWRAHPDSRDK